MELKISPEILDPIKEHASKAKANKTSRRVTRLLIPKSERIKNILKVYAVGYESAMVAYFLAKFNDWL